MKTEEDEASLDVPDSTVACQEQNSSSVQGNLRTDLASVGADTNSGLMAHLEAGGGRGVVKLLDPNELV